MYISLKHSTIEQNKARSVSRFILYVLRTKTALCMINHVMNLLAYLIRRSPVPLIFQHTYYNSQTENTIIMKNTALLLYGTSLQNASLTQKIIRSSDPNVLPGVEHTWSLAAGSSACEETKWNEMMILNTFQHSPGILIRFYQNQVSDFNWIYNRF